MKNTIRVHRKGAIKARSPQVQTHNDRLRKAALKQAKNPDFDLPNEDVHPNCLCIFSRESQEPVSRIPITENEFAYLLVARLRPEFRGMTTVGIVADAIREKLARSQNSRQKFDWESAARKAICLIDLILSRAIEEAGEELYPSLPGYNFDAAARVCGLMNLTNDVRKDLIAGLRSLSNTENEVAS